MVEVVRTDGLKRQWLRDGEGIEGQRGEEGGVGRKERGEEGGTEERTEGPMARRKKAVPFFHPVLPKKLRLRPAENEGGKVRIRGDEEEWQW